MESIVDFVFNYWFLLKQTYSDYDCCWLRFELLVFAQTNLLRLWLSYDNKRQINDTIIIHCRRNHAYEQKVHHRERGFDFLVT